jgi:hypothetical protein
LKYNLDKSAHSVFSLQYHLILVIKYRRKALCDEGLRERLKNIIWDLAKQLKIEIIAQEPAEDHMHILFKAKPAKLIIKFVEFAEVCKTYPDSQTNINNPRTEFTTRIFDVPSPADLKHYDLAFYVLKSGFSTVDDWLKTLKDADKIPECSTGRNKLFFVYHIQRALPIREG